MFHINFTTRIIKYCMLSQDVKLSLEVSNEGVYRVFKGSLELINTLDRKEAEDKFEYCKLIGEE